MKEIADKVSNCLASYAIPIFIRITKSVDKTGNIIIIKMFVKSY